MPPLQQVATADTCYSSEVTLETVQEIEVPRDSLSTCDSSYLSSPNLSSAYSTSPDTPSSVQTTFTIPSLAAGAQPFQHVGIPANDWGYDLYHSESRQSDSSSLKPKSVKSPRAFGFSKKMSVSDFTPGLPQLEPFKSKSSSQPPLHARPAPLTLNQLDILRAREVNQPSYTSRQQAAHQSRLASLTKFGHREQVTGAVKLVVRKKSEEGGAVDGEDEDVDAESIFTTITTSSTSSSGGSEIVPVYGRGGAGRAAGARVTMQTFGSMDELCRAQGMHSAEDLQSLEELRLGQSPRSAAAGISGGKAFLGKLHKKGTGSNTSLEQTDQGSSGSGSLRHPSPSANQGGPLSSSAPGAMTSRDSLATIHSLPLSSIPEPTRIVAYGRGGASRKALAVQEKGMKGEQVESEKPKSRAAALMSSMRKSDKDAQSKKEGPAETVTSEAIPAYGRGGFARKNRQ
ncbi:hypothetical protein P389DRAFT_195493 [Cystobasidium minutum MCA 4210]|uniref:uncharacterized protein n=1 Tax=Cystobasidium minutum MCA 4210 TaxID=1397322 RepID=UPI0034CFEBE8|eukprot:jgi/Rhomi1/195493/gm1.3707_g